MSEFSQRLDVAYLETLLNVFSQDSLYQALHVCSFIAQILHLRETSVMNIIHKSTFALGISLGGDTLCVNPMILAIFRERKWIKMYFVISASQMCSQFTAEQFGITTSDKYMQTCSHQAVHKQIPAVHILNLIKHKIRNIGAIKLIDARKHRVQIFYLHIGQTVVVKVHIAVSDASLQQHLVAQRRFSASTNTYNHLCHISVKLKQ